MSIQPPVIIIGMHRSGTSLLARTLSDLGLFVGEDLQDDYESVFFIRSNNRLLRQSGSTWDYPERYQSMMQKPEWLKQQATLARQCLISFRSACYAGMKFSRYFRTEAGLGQPWGWKDPRNTITLPIWMRLYPEAKIIHIKRHGVDVANSLYTRERRFTRNIASLFKAMGSQWPRDVDGKFANPLRCNRLDNTFKLWEFYTGLAHTHVNTWQKQSIEIRYEDFLLKPIETLEAVCSFLGLSIDHAVVSRLIGLTQVSRAFAFRKHKVLKEYAQRVEARLAAFGY